MDTKYHIVSVVPGFPHLLSKCSNIYVMRVVTGKCSVCTHINGFCVTMTGLVSRCLDIHTVIHYIDTTAVPPATPRKRGIKPNRNIGF